MNNILADAINYYDSESFKFRKLLIKIYQNLNLGLTKDVSLDNIIKKLHTNHYIFQQSEVNSNIMTFGNKNNETIYIKCKFFHLGNIYKNYWYWYWTVECKKNTIYKSQQILRYGLDINVDSSENEYPINLITRGLLINGKIEISNKTNQIILLKALSLYITNSNAIIELNAYDSEEINILVLYDVELLDSA